MLSVYLVCLGGVGVCLEVFRGCWSVCFRDLVMFESIFSVPGVFWGVLGLFRSAFSVFWTVFNVLGCFKCVLGCFKCILG